MATGDNPLSFRYRGIALGGTFDNIHSGHHSLFERAFSAGEVVYIGLTSDEFVEKMGKKNVHKFAFRKEQLESYLGKSFPGRRYTITTLNSTFGPGMYTKEVDAIAVSSETLPSVDTVNRKRVELGLTPLAVEVVPMLNAEDGKRISSTRIRAGEIDIGGKLLKNREQR